MSKTLLLFSLFAYTTSLGAVEPIGDSLTAAPVSPAAVIAPYADPTQMKDLSPAELEAFVVRFTTCTECWPLSVARLASFGDQILDPLEKACDGDDQFLDTAEHRLAYEAMFDRMAPYFMSPIEKSEYVQRETDKRKQLARARAHDVLLAIGTPRARAVRCGGPVR